MTECVHVCTCTCKLSILIMYMHQQHIKTNLSTGSKFCKLNETLHVYRRQRQRLALIQQEQHQAAWAYFEWRDVMSITRTSTRLTCEQHPSWGWCDQWRGWERSPSCASCCASAWFAAPAPALFRLRRHYMQTVDATCGQWTQHVDNRHNMDTEKTLHLDNRQCM